GAPRAEETRLVWRDRRGQSLGAVDLTGVSTPSLSRDDTLVAVSRGLPQMATDLWLYDVKRSTPMRFTFDSAGENSPIWSPDGKYVVFAASRNGLNQLYRKPTGSGADELISKIPGVHPTDWSADGRFILFHTTLGTYADQRTRNDLF